MSLLIGSVFSDHPRSFDWYKLQIKHLEKTTNDFNHVIYLNGSNNFYKKSNVLHVSHDEVKQQNAHVRGLNHIVEYFNSHNEYKNLLLLDSDAFPIRNLWETSLLESMDNAFDVAAVVRYENLDTFAHPSIFFVNRKSAANLKFGVFPQKNMVGYEYADTSSNIKKFFPLIRSNKINHHPVLCGVYYNIFYHHGAGSRNLNFKLFYHYWSKKNNLDWVDSNFSIKEKKLFEDLIDNSENFISKIVSEDFFKKKRIFL